MINQVTRLAREFGGVAVLLALLTGSLVTNVVLVRLVRDRPVQPGKIAGVQVGSVFPRLTLRRVTTGETVELPLASDRRTVIYVLSPHCGWCNQNYSNIRALATAQSTRYAFLAVSQSGSLQDVRDYLRHRPLPFETYLLESDQLRDRYGLSATPQTLVIDKVGAVEESWMGAFFGPRLATIQAFFGVALPGLEPEAQLPQGGAPAR